MRSRRASKFECAAKLASRLAPGTSVGPLGRPLEPESPSPGRKNPFFGFPFGPESGEEFIYSSSPEWFCLRSIASSVCWPVASDPIRGPQKRNPAGFQFSPGVFICLVRLPSDQVSLMAAESWPSRGPQLDRPLECAPIGSIAILNFLRCVSHLK